ncbi:TIGR04086 family membrane protein [Blautia liquoris]|uniref:TIGR04086 family membrane protein n=1 Tax=Blautia liquoris TaxID=2779518 RepID=A0A7M2RLA9_9FIRM|nr:TIGR04086 family membrane protein [Blautia liquoris]QOV20851.1 TIGR04086 family membrane protein [Blautia liquoris]
METQQYAQKILRVGKALLAAYVVTAVCLLTVAFLLLKLDLSQSNVSVGIIVTYLVSCFLGGFILGKTMEQRKFLWGMVLGIIYFLITLIISLVAFHGISSSVNHLFTTLLICIAGGMAGGMVS